MANPKKVKARVSSVIRHGAGTYSVSFEPEGKAPLHKPGQFLHLTVDEYDPAGGFWPESRVFSIASGPGSKEIKIVYSVKGRYTKLMEERLAPGFEVWLKLPYGDFVIESAIGPGEDAVLVAGGTGISPYLPYLEKLLASGARERRVRLYYGVRENSMLIASELISRSVSSSLIEVAVFVENEAPGVSIPEGAECFSGRLDIDRIRSESAELSNPVFFLSGPPAMTQVFKKRLEETGTKPGRIKIDEWE